MEKYVLLTNKNLVIGLHANKPVGTCVVETLDMTSEFRFEYYSTIFYWYKTATSKTVEIKGMSYESKHENSTKMQSKTTMMEFSSKIALTFS